jgi:hypothetical protein
MLLVLLKMNCFLDKVCNCSFQNIYSWLRFQCFMLLVLLKMNCFFEEQSLQALKISLAIP